MAIALYGTSQIFVKLVLALWHHFKFHLTCCFNMLEKGRKEKVDALWARLYQEYRDIEEMTVSRMSHSKIIDHAAKSQRPAAR